MDDQVVGQAVLFVVGLGLLVTTPQGGYWISVEERVSQSGVSDEATVVEYADRSPDHQDAFETALAGEEARLSDPPERLTDGPVYVHYGEHSYRLSFEVSDRMGSGQVFTGLLVLAAASVWTIRRYWVSS